MTEQLANSILELAKTHKRFFVAIAGAPASGKSTLCTALEDTLKQKTSASVVAMDGFHYDNAILQNKNLLDRKGSPDTFDVASLHLLLNGLKNQTETLAVPVFDRDYDLARSSAKLVHPEDHIILVEGNYLLCKTDPWKKLHRLFDQTVCVTASIETLEQRLIQRWLDHNHTHEQAVERANHNDLPNAKYVVEHSIEAASTIHN